LDKNGKWVNYCPKKGSVVEKREEFDNIKEVSDAYWHVYHRYKTTAMKYTEPRVFTEDKDITPLIMRVKYLSDIIEKYDKQIQEAKQIEKKRDECIVDRQVVVKLLENM
jgi:hypothetical protein